MNKKQEISMVLKELGVPANVLGYHYLRFAIELVMDEALVGGIITKVVYPRVAECFDSTPFRVDRCARQAIQIGWHRGNKELQAKLFGYTIDTNRGFPTVGEFVATVADYFTVFEQECGESDG